MKKINFQPPYVNALADVVLRALSRLEVLIGVILKEGGTVSMDRTDAMLLVAALKAVPDSRTYEGFDIKQRKAIITFLTQEFNL